MNADVWHSLMATREWRALEIMLGDAANPVRAHCFVDDVLSRVESWARFYAPQETITDYEWALLVNMLESEREPVRAHCAIADTLECVEGWLHAITFEENV